MNALAELDYKSSWFKPNITGYRIAPNDNYTLFCKRQNHQAIESLGYTMFRETRFGHTVTHEFQAPVQIKEKIVDQPELIITIETKNTALSECSENWNNSVANKFVLTPQHIERKLIPYADIGKHIEPYADCENKIHNHHRPFLQTHDPTQWKATLHWGQHSKDITQTTSAMLQQYLCDSQRLNKKAVQVLTTGNSEPYKPNTNVLNNLKLHLFNTFLLNAISTYQTHYL